MVKVNVNTVILIGMVVSLIISREAWPVATVIVALLAKQSYDRFLDSAKSIDSSQEMKDRVSSLESKIAMMSLSKRNG